LASTLDLLRHSFNESAVGEETYCDKNDTKTQTLFAWEFNVMGRRRDGVGKKAPKYRPTDKSGRRVDWYGCLNHKCCGVLKAWIAANRAYFFAAACCLFLLLLMGIYVAIKIANDVESKNTHAIAHGKDICIGVFIGFLLIFAGIASIAVATSVPISPQKSRNSILNDKNITADLAISSNESTSCHSTMALGGNGTCVSCFNGLLDGDEAGIDCGGSCAVRCQAGQQCSGSGNALATSHNRSNCDSGLSCSTTAHVCIEPTPYDLCMNGVMDAGESCVDGGYACMNTTGKLCALNENCEIDGDCQSNSCHSKPDGPRVCVSCTDGGKFVCCWLLCLFVVCLFVGGVFGGVFGGVLVVFWFSFGVVLIFCPLPLLICLRSFFLHYLFLSFTVASYFQSHWSLDVLVPRVSLVFFYVLLTSTQS